MFPTQEQLLAAYPALRRHLTNGFRYNPFRDAKHLGMVCLESPRQRLFVNPETGYTRVGAIWR